MSSSASAIRDSLYEVTSAVCASPFTCAVLSNVLSEMCHFQMKSGEFHCNKKDKQVTYNPAHYSKLFIKDNKACRNSLPQEIYSYIS